MAKLDYEDLIGRPWVEDVAECIDVCAEGLRLAGFDHAAESLLSCRESGEPSDDWLMLSSDPEEATMLGDLILSFREGRSHVSILCDDVAALVLSSSVVGGVHTMRRERVRGTQGVYRYVR